MESVGVSPELKSYFLIPSITIEEKTVAILLGAIEKVKQTNSGLDDGSTEANICAFLISVAHGIDAI